MSSKYLLILCMFLFMGFTSSLGCCVSSNQESCSTNSEETSCVQYGGIFYNNDWNCGSVRVCDSGCCILGLDSARMTRGQCQSETQDRDFSAINFLQTSEDCNKYIVSQEWGACVGSDSFGKKSCKFVTRTQCAGEFFSDKLCSGMQNSNCNKTKNTVCLGNKIYFVDSCGNRDAFAEECDYNLGSVCKQTNDGEQYFAECVTANCEDDFDFSSFVLEDLYEQAPSFSPIERKQGETWCVTNGMVPFTDEEYNRELGVFEKGVSGITGLRYFSRSCINGKIVTEPCLDGKESFCSGSSDWEDTESLTGTGGKCVANDWRSCLSAENEEDCNLNYCFWYAPEKITSGSSTMIKELSISKCLPKIAGGTVDGTSTSSICSQGDYETTFSFTNSMARLSKKSNTKFGNAGFLLGDESSWKIKTTTSLVAGENNLYLSGGMASLVSKGKFPFIILNPEAIAYLEYRCSMISDCTGKLNWVGEAGRNSSGGIEFMSADEIKKEFTLREVKWSTEEQAVLNRYLSKTGLEDYDLGNYPVDKFPVLFGGTAKKTMDMKLEYTCVPRKASYNGECSKCSSGGSVCSQYVCSSLGANCEYVDLGGFGTCENKGDISSPIINIECPSSASIGIQKPVTIKVNTSEISQCRFDLENAGAIYDVMKYDLGKTWSTNHETILTIPGSNKILVGDATQYPLLLRSGTYSLFIRCVDPKGNGDAEPAKLCSFDIPKTPDRNPPTVLKFNPKSGTPIIFNTTTKEISMLVNEPVECKWSLKDIDFNLMENEFDCGSTLVFSNDISGYECNSELTNITKNIGNSTKFYIRCKDQPELEGEETDVYMRNTNDKSAVYSLKASQKLEIVELSPKGRVTLGPNFADWNLSVKTAGGGYEGITECKWKLNYRNISTAFSAFSTTQSTFKSQSINQKTEGDYTLSVTCADDSDNTVNYSGPLEIRYDRIAPGITRVYNDKGNIKVTTNEPSICKFTNLLSVGIGCAFTIAHPNLTAMTDSSTTEHFSLWKKGVNYFIKCQDFYGNENTLCGTIAKTV